MTLLNRRTKVFLSKDPADMRASYDSLFLKARDVVKEDPFSGHLFVFLNKRRTSVKCLCYDGTGFVLLCKRLERGLFARVNPHHPGDVVLTQAEFNLFFEGADLTKRFVDSPREIKKSAHRSQSTAANV
jgi:transposase